MALSMDEQRILAEMERRLSDEDPALAARLTSFSAAGLGSVLRAPRGRVLVCLLGLAVIAMVSVMAYTLAPFRVHGRPTGPVATAAPSSSERAAAKPVGSATSIASGSQAPSPSTSR